MVSVTVGAGWALADNRVPSPRGSVTITTQSSTDGATTCLV